MISRADEYAERAERFARRASDLSRRSRLVSNLRGLAFGAFVVLGLVAIFGGAGWAAGSVALGSAGLFVTFIVWHARVLAAEDEAWRWTQVNRDAKARCTDDWHDFPEDGQRFGSDNHPYAGDLDVFGRGSLFQRLNVAHTYHGQAALARFLAQPTSVRDVVLRQEAGRALSAELELRQRLEALSLGVAEPIAANVVGSAEPSRARRKSPDPEGFFQWAEGAPRLSTRTALVWASRVFPVVTLTLLGLSSVFGWGPVVWLLPAVVQVAIISTVRAETARVFASVSSTQGAFLRYAPMLELLEGIAIDAELIQSLRRRMHETGARPSTSMRRFQRALGWFELRHNGLVHPFINALTLWDIHCVLSLEAWQRDSGRHVRGWFEALGELEALSSFAGFAYDDPGACWPEVVEGPALFEAEQIGHPLIFVEKRKYNDISLPEPGRALLITGSNMSGKSTLLRSMGLGAVMALAGSPVCAKRLVCSRLAVRTSVRVSDSLERGVSHFYAEITKLKLVLDSTLAGERVFFLLDEILHGTNSRERQIGARWLLARLLEVGAIGAVSTHDIELCRLDPPLMDHVSQFHFRETVRDGAMTFDYALRPGPVSGGNALRLMRELGIAVPVDTA